MRQLQECKSLMYAQSEANEPNEPNAANVLSVSVGVSVTGPHRAAAVPVTGQVVVMP